MEASSALADSTSTAENMRDVLDEIEQTHVVDNQTTISELPDYDDESEVTPSSSTTYTPKPFTTPERLQEAFQFPVQGVHSLAWDEDCNHFYMSTSSCIVRCSRETGTIVDVIGNIGSMYGCLSVDRSGTLFVINETRRCIQVFKCQGRIMVKEWSVDIPAYEEIQMAVREDGSVLILDNSKKHVLVYTATGNLTETVELPVSKDQTGLNAIATSRHDFLVIVNDPFKNGICLSEIKMNGQVSWKYTPVELAPMGGIKKEGPAGSGIASVTVGENAIYITHSFNSNFAQVSLAGAFISEVSVGKQNQKISVGGNHLAVYGTGGQVQLYNLKETTLRPSLMTGKRRTKLSIKPRRRFDHSISHFFENRRHSKRLAERATQKKKSEATTGCIAQFSAMWNFPDLNFFELANDQTMYMSQSKGRGGYFCKFSLENETMEAVIGDIGHNYQGVGKDGPDDIYVLNMTQRRVMIVKGNDDTNIQYTDWEVDFNCGKEISVTAEGEILLYDEDKHGVHRYSKQDHMNYFKVPLPMRHILAVENNVALIGKFNNELKLFDAAGKLVWEPPNEEVKTPIGLAADQNHLYIADVDNCRVARVMYSSGIWETVITPDQVDGHYLCDLKITEVYHSGLTPSQERILVTRSNGGGVLKKYKLAPASHGQHRDQNPDTFSLHD